MTPNPIFWIILPEINATIHIPDLKLVRTVYDADLASIDGQIAGNGIRGGGVNGEAEKNQGQRGSGRVTVLETGEMSGFHDAWYLGWIGIRLSVISFFKG